MNSITAVVNGHREGLIAGATIESYNEAVAMARASGIEVECLIILDRPDEFTYSQFVSAGEKYGYRVITVEYGDLGLSRNRGANESKGEFVAFLDADDLWCYDWLVKAHQFCQKAPLTTIAHPQAYLLFEQLRALVIHRDSLDPDFDSDFLRAHNYWDSLAFAHRSIFLQHPYHNKDFAAGYGYEDWHWNCLTLETGIAHRPVPGTLHFKRRRVGSLMASCSSSDVVPWPTAVTRYDFVFPETSVLPRRQHGFDGAPSPPDPKRGRQR